MLKQKKGSTSARSPRFDYRVKAGARRDGFTLIELLVVIAIIGLLASVVLVSLNGARIKARNTQRKATLSQLQKALELYYNDNNAYPSSGGTWRSSEAGDTNVTPDPTNYIPGLVPNYVSKLPADPKGGPSSNPVCGATWMSAFLYNSDTVNYKLLSHCAPEGSWTSSDTFYDSVRPIHAWQVSTPAVTNVW